MKYDTIAQITDGYAIDFDAPGAAMRLAWKLTAQELWSAREFDTDHRDLFARLLKTAWAHVKMIRETRRKAAAAAKDERVQQLQAERRLLDNRSFRYPIADEQRRIDAQINAIKETL
jgi:hypothetical protein